MVHLGPQILTSFIYNHTMCFYILNRPLFWYSKSALLKLYVSNDGIIIEFLKTLFFSPSNFKLQMSCFFKLLLKNSSPLFFFFSKRSFEGVTQTPYKFFFVCWKRIWNNLFSLFTVVFIVLNSPQYYIYKKSIFFNKIEVNIFGLKVIVLSLIYKIFFKESYI